MSVSMLTRCAIAVLAVAAITEPLAAQVAGDPLADSVVSSGPSEQLRIRLTATFDGVGWREHCSALQRRRVESLFDQLDADKSGGLSVAEAKRLPLSRIVRRDEESGVFVALNFLVLDDDRDGAVSLAEIERFVAGVGVGGPSESPIATLLETAAPPTRGGGLFGLLDANRDGRLAADETKAAETLMERDRDGNRVLTKDELRSFAESAFGPEFVAAPIAGGGTARPLAVRAANDRDTAGAAQVNVTIAWSSDKPDDATIEVTLNDAAREKKVEVVRAEEGPIALRFAGQQIELRLAPSRIRRDEELRQSLVREFSAVHERSKANLTAGESMADSLRAIFLVADGDADGTLTESEFDRCLDGFLAADQAVQSSRLRLTSWSRPGGLGSLADLNLDGRFSQREIAGLPAALAALATDSDGALQSDAPAVLTLFVERGPFAPSQQLQAMLLEAGPPWFYRADRNQDGDLDRTEFLGPVATFQQFDANGDGWIDLNEAVHGDRQSGSSL